MKTENYHLKNAREMYRNGHREAARQADQMAVAQLSTLAPNSVRLYFRTAAGKLLTTFDACLDKPQREQIQQAWAWLEKVNPTAAKIAVLCHE